jgi:hypothetical protein
MKKLLFSCALLLIIPGVGHGMDMQNAIKRNDWRSVAELLWWARDLDHARQLTTVLIESKTNLNVFGIDNHCLINQLVDASYTDSNAGPETKERHGNMRFALTELIKRDKLDPTLQYSGRLAVALLCAPGKDLADNRYYKVLQDVCDEVSAEKCKNASIFHRYELSRDHGLSRFKSIWSPWSLLVDRRVWAALAAVLVVRGIYAVYTHSKEQSDEPTDTDNEEQVNQDQQKEA